MDATFEDQQPSGKLPDGLWRRGDGTNLVGVPAGFIAGTDFNAANRPLHIAGVREMNGPLFRMLEQAADEAEAGDAFTAYMATMFGLSPRPPAAVEGGGRRRYRTSYLRLLRGWAFDSNSPEGAVLKGWVESRFGLFPTYHREPLRRFDGKAWGCYVDEKMGSRFHNNAIFSQLDLLYEYAQWALRRGAPDRGPLKLFRGVNDFDEHPIVERIDKRWVVLRLNNLVSFTSDRAIASCFGDRILQTEVPLAKVLFVHTLLPRHSLKGEDEVLAIGGDYLVRATYW
ncbi:MAG: NAD(+)--dinitrogen-reductase ADP-D-ribosyltransferase [Rhodospirillales bacterium]